jgi:hypothetical protein
MRECIWDYPNILSKIIPRGRQRKERKSTKARVESPLAPTHSQNEQKKNPPFSFEDSLIFYLSLPLEPTVALDESEGTRGEDGADIPAGRKKVEVRSNGKE